MHFRQLPVMLGTTLLFLSSSFALAHEAHVHGVGKLDIALSGKTLSLHLDSPLVNLIGFEHAARSANDKQAAESMARTLRDAATVFVTTPSAECKPAEVKLTSAALAPVLPGNSTRDNTPAPQDHDGHADLDADFTFECSHPERLTTIDVRLFDTFSGFHRIDVQLVTEKRQRAATLTPGAGRVAVQ